MAILLNPIFTAANLLFHCVALFNCESQLRGFAGYKTRRLSYFGSFSAGVLNRPLQAARLRTPLLAR